jgi:hypothetical protein
MLRIQSAGENWMEQYGIFLFFGEGGTGDELDKLYRCTVHLDIIKIFHSPTDALFINPRKL